MPEPTLSQRARELLAREHERDGGQRHLDQVIHVSKDRALRAIESALSSPIGEGVRDEVIEECARVANEKAGLADRMATYSCPAASREKGIQQRQARNIAEGIRRLKSQSLTPGHRGEARG